MAKTEWPKLTTASLRPAWFPDGGNEGIISKHLSWDCKHARALANSLAKPRDTATVYIRAREGYH